MKVFRYILAILIDIGLLYLMFFGFHITNQYAMTYERAWWFLPNMVLIIVFCSAGGVAITTLLFYWEDIREDIFKKEN